ncbi:hypothetical protein FACS1894137_14070 [Spirochaetia bacterium]|nr:hypothetical protein FACS1894137_14070 [Spirochaetia bacterium]
MIERIIDRSPIVVRSETGEIMLVSSELLNALGFLPMIDGYPQCPKKGKCKYKFMPDEWDGYLCGYNAWAKGFGSLINWEGRRKEDVTE